MDRRIFGLETEYGVTCTYRGQRRLSPDEVARYLFRRVVSWGRSSNVFLRNGARLYLDVGSHPEYATPECDSVTDVVIHDRAGERILEGLLVDAEKRLHDEGIAGEIYLFKNNTDSAGNSYGCHENYLVSRHGEFGRLADILIPFLVTRQLICGAGKVLQTPRGAVYCLSQRAEHIWEGVSSATTRSRPIINTRDEPHADAERYRRLHVIVGDSNMNEVTTLLKVGSADIVLRMIEAGVAMRDLTLENPIRAIREVSHDVTGRRKVRLVNGKECSALEIQQEYFAKASEFVERRGGDSTAKRVVELWGRVLAAVEAGDLSGVEREIDWVTKLRLIERYQARHDLALSLPRVAQMDLAYHDLRRNRGLYALLERKGAVDRVGTDLEIFEAKETPPQTTRARLRGEFIRHAQEKRRDFTVDWVHLKLNDQAQRTVLCKDPFRAYDERVDLLRWPRIDCRIMADPTGPTGEQPDKPAQPDQDRTEAEREGYSLADIQLGWLARRRQKVRAEVERNRRGEYRVPTWVLTVLLVALVAGLAALIFLVH
jgi:proteasome accessory factor A